MDTAHIAQLGMSPLAPEFARIAAIKNLSDVSTVVAHDQYIGASPLYGLALYQDEKHSDRYAVHLFQGGLGLPDRDYYTDTDDHAQDASARIRRARRRACSACWATTACAQPQTRTR